jgi:hydroxymethylglutaryl-CoA reductase (NADPH)
MFIPSLLLKQLYTFGSLENTADGVQFSLKNRLSDASFAGLWGVKMDGSPIPLDQITLDFGGGDRRSPVQISPEAPVDFPLRKVVMMQAAIPPLPEGKHKIEITFQGKPFGKLSFGVDDAISAKDEDRVMIPRDLENDYAPEIVRQRQEFVEAFTGKKLEHIPAYSFEPGMIRGNTEHFTGVAQIPLGFAGPLKINGEHALGEFLIPLATTEGTLVASYNRGMKLLNLCGGVTCTVTEDVM